MTVADYVVGVNSDAMSFARARVTESIALKRDLGEIREVRLRRFWGFRNYSDSVAAPSPPGTAW